MVQYSVITIKIAESSWFLTESLHPLQKPETPVYKSCSSLKQIWKSEKEVRASRQQSTSPSPSPKGKPVIGHLIMIYHANADLDNARSSLFFNMFNVNGKVWHCISCCQNIFLHLKHSKTSLLCCQLLSVISWWAICCLRFTILVEYLHFLLQRKQVQMNNLVVTWHVYLSTGKP